MYTYRLSADDAASLSRLSSISVLLLSTSRLTRPRLLDFRIDCRLAELHTNVTSPPYIQPDTFTGGMFLRKGVLTPA